MDYQKHYDRLVLKRQVDGIDGYSEKHHIVPKCLGGSNGTDNIVRLTPEEHYVAHQLLTRIHPENNKLLFAAICMTRQPPQGKRFGNKLFGWLRRRFAQAQTGKTVSESTREKLRAYRLGKKADPTNIAKMRAGINEETFAKISAANTGRKHSTQSIENMRDGRLKSGYTHSEETREKLRVASTGFKASEETRDKLSRVRKGVKFSEEHKANLSSAIKEAKKRQKESGYVYPYKPTSEHKAKITAANLLRWEKQRQKQSI